MSVANSAGDEPVVATARVVVLPYASATDPSRAARRARVILPLLSSFYLFAGGLVLFWLLYVLANRFGSSASDLIPAVAMMLAGCALLLPIGICLLSRRPVTWRVTRLLLGIGLVVMLLIILFGCGLMISYRHAKGMDGLAIVIGLFLAIAASIPFWLNLFTVVYLLRPHVRAMFGVSTEAVFRGRRWFVRGLWITYAAAGFVTMAAFLVG